MYKSLFNSLLFDPILHFLHYSGTVNRGNLFSHEVIFCVYFFLFFL